LYSIQAPGREVKKKKWVFCWILLQFRTGNDKRNVRSAAHIESAGFLAITGISGYENDRGQNKN